MRANRHRRGRCERDGPRHTGAVDASALPNRGARARRREGGQEGAMADPEAREEPQPKGVDLVTVLYILGGIP
ncbi:hypothetical protein, partial [Salinigranum sp.]|uniref:hypothetical protein n=1 Tax=Salinigranum sp. TaxID=1966351 RepID=UPI003565A9B6